MNIIAERVKNKLTKTQFEAEENKKLNSKQKEYLAKDKVKQVVVENKQINVESKVLPID